MSLRQIVIVGILWGSGAKFFAQLITWDIIIVVIRLLSPADYGLMSLAAVFVGFLAMLNEMGLGTAVVQRKDIGINTLKSMFGLVLLTSASFSILISISAPLIADSYSEPRLTPLIQVLAVQFILTGFTILPQSLLLRDMAFTKIAYVDFISALAGSITTLMLALTNHGVWALVWGAPMGQMVAMIGMNLAQPFLHLPIANMKGMRSFLSFGGYVVLSRII